MNSVTFSLYNKKSNLIAYILQPPARRLITYTNTVMLDLAAVRAIATQLAMREKEQGQEAEIMLLVLMD